jgi:hypothetical protein
MGLSRLANNLSKPDNSLPKNTHGLSHEAMGRLFLRHFFCAISFAPSFI